MNVPNSITEFVLVTIGVIGLIMIIIGLFIESYKKRGDEWLIFGIVFVLIATVGVASYRHGAREGYKLGQIDARKGKWRYNIIIKPTFELKEQIIEVQ